MTYHRFVLTDDGHGGSEPETVRWWTVELLCWPEPDRQTAANEAVHWLREHGCDRPSSVNFQPHAWYTSDPIVDGETGEYEEISAHLRGFSKIDLRRIWDRLPRRQS